MAKTRSLKIAAVADPSTKRQGRAEEDRLRIIAETIEAIRDRSGDVLVQEDDVRATAEWLEVPYLFLVIFNGYSVRLADVAELTRNQAAMAVLRNLETAAAAEKAA